MLVPRIAMILFVSAGAVGAQTPPVAAVPAPLALTCSGGGTAKKPQGTLVQTGGAWATISSWHGQQFSDQADVRLFDGDDRIRIPRTMLPELHGGKDGWFKLKDVVADARSIRAKALVNYENHPKVYIDRVTGTISISGKFGDYMGGCQAIDPNAKPKF